MSRRSTTTPSAPLRQDPVYLLWRLMLACSELRALAIAMEAFQRLPEGERLAAWNRVPARARKRLESSFLQFEGAFRRFNEMQASLPETGDAPLAAPLAGGVLRPQNPDRLSRKTLRKLADLTGDPVLTDAALDNEQLFDLLCRTNTVGLRKPHRKTASGRTAATTASRPRLSSAQESFREIRGTPAGLDEVTPEDASRADRLMAFFRRIDSMSSALSLARLEPHLGNGTPATETEVMRAFRTLGVAWNLPVPKDDEPNVDLIGSVRRFRAFIGNKAFASFINELLDKDRSPDAVRLRDL